MLLVRGGEQDDKREIGGGGGGGRTPLLKAGHLSTSANLALFLKL